MRESAKIVLAVELLFVVWYGKPIRSRPRIALRHQNWISETENGKAEQGGRNEKDFPKGERVDAN